MTSTLSPPATLRARDDQAHAVRNTSGTPKRLDGIEPGRQRQHVARVERDVLAIDAVAVLAADLVVVGKVIVAGAVVRRLARAVAGLDHHLLSDARPGDARAERRDLAGAVAAERARERDREARHPATHPEIEVVDARGEHACTSTFAAPSARAAAGRRAGARSGSPWA
jgi:hypothetical protein